MNVNGWYIYFLKDDGVIVYVGQTKTIIARMHSHKNDKDKSFDSIEFFEFTEGTDLSVEEFKSILKHQPKYNKQLPPLSFAVSKNRIEKINLCLEDSGIAFEKYDENDPDLVCTLDGVTYKLWAKRGKEAQFFSCLSGMCNGLESKL
jgi:hypothetical protein